MTLSDIKQLAYEVNMWGEDLLALNMKGGIPVTQAAKVLLQQAEYIRLLEKLCNENGLGVGRNLLTGEIIPFGETNEVNK